jgi:hypothetical protein
MNSNTVKPDLSGVMRRLRKIMALAKSSNPGEAGAALHQAQVLMAKHNLTADEAQPSAGHDTRHGTRTGTGTHTIQALKKKPQTS